MRKIVISRRPRIMSSIPPETSINTHMHLSSTESLQFEWLRRAGRLSGMAILIVSSDMQIRFYDPNIAEILELDTSKDFTHSNLLDIVGQLANRGDFGPGDPQVFMDLLKQQFSISTKSNAPEARSLNFLTPSGRRIQFRLDLETDGFFMLGCRDITKSYVEKQALKVAMDISNSGYLIFDMETRQFQTHSDVGVNPFNQNLTRRLIDRNHKDNIHQGDYKKLKTIWMQAHKKKESWEGSFRTKDDKGETI